MQKMSAKPILIGIIFLATGNTWSQPDPPPTQHQSVRSQVRVSQLFGWQPLDNEHILLWTGKEEVWRLGVDSHCASLLKNRNIEVTSDTRHIKVGRDQILTGEQSCTIREFALPEKQERKKYRNPRKGFLATLQTIEPAGSANDVYSGESR